ncbi:MAG TPA: pyridoxamine 5'-phosphate oxidase [Chitinophagaceae bacterium]|jgi:pyridoxamine 5'-phosphate oxidase|nr:pyridoxamine 5'-phosphate oxidase [Chitinophagaceae bacterium]MBP9739115.1 pyridoxamine 5'-phosphate oxidase [Chitinophagaceae bacterium]HPH23188.1 pyridoxamine 5'-phosphate oxidase [Chitinophagaceae bacterium]
MNTSIADIRKDYKLASFDETDAAANPINQFTNWWNDATKSNIDEVNAMTLATVTPKNTPSARIVLLKGYDEKGFVFFSNYLSDKGKELSNNPTAALVFFWKELERQVRIEGVVEKVSEQESDEYFNSRPASSRIGAWASHQSAIIEYRQVIEQNVEKYTEAFGGDNIPRPDHWGGYRVMPTLIEFWQGRSSRLHDRIQYRKVEQAWIKERLAP